MQPIPGHGDHDDLISALNSLVARITDIREWSDRHAPGAES